MTGRKWKPGDAGVKRKLRRAAKARSEAQAVREEAMRQHPTARQPVHVKTQHRCEGKRQYATLERAQLDADELAAMVGQPYEVYRCDGCTGVHVGGARGPAKGEDVLYRTGSGASEA